jgi:hypothetical protein
VTWETVLEDLSITELHDLATLLHELGYPIPVDVYTKLAEAGYWL